MARVLQMPAAAALVRDNRADIVGTADAARLTGAAAPHDADPPRHLGRRLCVGPRAVRGIRARRGVDLCFQNFAAELLRLPRDMRAAAAMPAAGARGRPGRRTVWACGRSAPTPGVCEMKRLYARPKARGRPRTAARHGGRWTARPRGRVHSGMVLDTLDWMTPAITLYRSLGFVDTAAYYRNPLPVWSCPGAWTSRPKEPERCRSFRISTTATCRRRWRSCRRRFGAKAVGDTVMDARGRVTHASVLLGDDMLMMGYPGPSYKSPKQLGQTALNLYVGVPDVDKHHAKAKKARAKIMEGAPRHAACGHRRYAVGGSRRRTTGQLWHELKRSGRREASDEEGTMTAGVSRLQSVKDLRRHALPATMPRSRPAWPSDVTWSTAASHTQLPWVPVPSRAGPTCSTRSGRRPATAATTSSPRPSSRRATASRPSSTFTLQLPVAGDDKPETRRGRRRISGSSTPTVLVRNFRQRSDLSEGARTLPRAAAGCCPSSGR